MAICFLHYKNLVDSYEFYIAIHMLPKKNFKYHFNQIYLSNQINFIFALINCQDEGRKKLSIKQNFRNYGFVIYAFSFSMAKIPDKKKGDQVVILKKNYNMA